MSDLAYIEDFGPQSSKKVKKDQIFETLNQRKSKNSYRSKWAKKFIQINNLQTSTFSKQSCFKLLEQKDQQAIRYQMRKIQKNKVGEYQTQANSSSKQLFDISYKLFSLIPICSVEFLIIIFSTRFYLTLGFQKPYALIFAISIEIFYMIFSSVHKKGFFALRYLFLAFSIFTVAYSSYIRDSGINKYLQTLSENKQHLESQLMLAEKNINQHREEKASILNSMAIYQRYDKVSVGLSKLNSIRKDNQQNLTNTLKKKEKITTQLNQLSLRNSRIGLFSLETIKSTQLATWIIVIGFFLIQLSSSFLIKDALDAFKHTIKNIFFKKDYL